MHLAFVVPGGLDSASGGYRYDRRLVDGLRDLGWEVDVFNVAAGGYHRRLRSCLSPQFARNLTGDRYDVILEDELAHPNLVLLNPYLRRRGDARIVTLVHQLRERNPARTDRLGIARTFESRYLRGVDAYVCNSRASSDAVAEHTDPRPGIVAYPGREEELPVSNRSIPGAAGELSLGFVGHPRPIKGLDVLLRAVARLTCEWRLTIVGSRQRDPGYNARIDEMIDALGIASRIAFTGAVDSAFVMEVLQRVDLLVVPSRYEAFGMSYLEAMCQGVPPVASTAGGAAEFIEDGRSGFLIEPEDVDGLTSLLSDLASDADLRARVGRAAANRASTHPSWETTATDIHRFLHALRTST